MPLNAGLIPPKLPMLFMLPIPLSVFMLFIELKEPMLLDICPIPCMLLTCIMLGIWASFWVAVIGPDDEEVLGPIWSTPLLLPKIEDELSVGKVLGRDERLRGCV